MKDLITAHVSNWDMHVVNLNRMKINMYYEFNKKKREIWNLDGVDLMTNNKEITLLKIP